MCLWPSSTLSFDDFLDCTPSSKLDAALRKQYFKELDIFFYTGASLPFDVWKAAEEMAVAERGEIPLMMSSWGMTETAATTIIMRGKGGKSGNIGVPAPDVTLKLIPVSENRYELRCKGPNIFKGCFEDSKKNQKNF